MRNIWILLLCWGGFWASAWADHPEADARPDDHIVARAFLADPGGRLDVAAVAQRTGDFQPLPKDHALLARGYTTDATWLRLHVRGTDPLVLRVQPPYLDDVRAYTATPTGWHEQVGGDRLPWAPQQRADVGLHFALQPDAVNQGVVYLRIKTTSATVAHVEALPPQVAARRARFHAVMVGLHIGLSVIVLLWSLRHYLDSREPLLVPFAVYQGLGIVAGLGIGGFIDADGWEAQAEVLVNMAICSTVSAAVWFHTRFLGAHGGPQRCVQWLRRSLWVWPLNLGLLLAGQTLWAMQSNALVALFTASAFVYCAVRLPGLPRGTHYGIAATYIALWYTAVPLLLALLGWPAAGDPSLYAVVYQTMMAAVLMFLWLERRASAQRTEREHLVQRARLAAERAEWERQQRSLQRRFLDMLTHELRAALSVVKMGLGATRLQLAQTPLGDSPRLLRMERAVDDMGVIIERCILADRLSHEPPPVQCQPQDLAAVWGEVCSAHPEAASRLQGSIPPGVRVLADGAWLRTMLGNALDNALKYAPADAPIGLALDRELPPPHRAALRLHNPLPPGQPAPEAQRLFTRYYRGAHAQARSGTGLGLYLVRELARLQGGDAQATVSPQGFTLTLLLPLLTDTPAAPAGRAAPLEVAP